MKKITIDNRTFSIMDICIEEIEGEYLAYNSENETIIIFNKTASIIWDYIIEAAKKNQGITLEEICKMIIDEYNIPENEFEIVNSDVHDLLLNFLERKILTPF